MAAAWKTWPHDVTAPVVFRIGSMEIGHAWRLASAVVSTMAATCGGRGVGLCSGLCRGGGCDKDAVIADSSILSKVGCPRRRGISTNSVGRR